MSRLCFKPAGGPSDLAMRIKGFSPCPEPPLASGADMLTRPPPLQLLLDNTRPGLRPEQQPQQQPLPVAPSKPGLFAQIATFAAQVYQANWRNFVIAIAAVNAFRFIVSAWSSFYDAGIDYRNSQLSKLAKISIALGALYLITAIIQIFGAASAAMQRPTLIRVYVYLAFLAGLLITTAGFVTGIEYFLLSEDIISECVQLAVTGSWISKSIFRGKLRHGQIPTPKVAQEQCIMAWSHGSISQVVGIFLFSVVPAIVFFLLAYMYYRQTTDPSHSACLNSKSGNSEATYIRMEACPDPSPIYNGTSNGNETGVAGAQPLRARTPRVPPNRAPLILRISPIHSEAASPYGVSPGPPSYAPPRGTYGYGQVWFGGAGNGR